MLGLVYEKGLLVPRDLPATKSWMLRSTEERYAPSQAAMGEMYLSKVRDNGPIPDYGDADRRLRLAATQNHADAQFWLGQVMNGAGLGGIPLLQSNFCHPHHHFLQL